MLAMRAGGRFVEPALLARVFRGDELRVPPLAQLLQNAKRAIGGLEIALSLLGFARGVAGEDFDPLQLGLQPGCVPTLVLQLGEVQRAGRGAFAPHATLGGERPLHGLLLRVYFSEPRLRRSQPRQAGVALVLPEFEHLFQPKVKAIHEGVDPANAGLLKCTTRSHGLTER